MNEDVTSDPGSSSFPITAMSGVVIFRQYRLNILLPCVRLTEKYGKHKEDAVDSPRSCNEPCPSGQHLGQIANSVAARFGTVQWTSLK